jgi:hypothetical protein
MTEDVRKDLDDLMVLTEKVVGEAIEAAARIVETFPVWEREEVAAAVRRLKKEVEDG